MDNNTNAFPENPQNENENEDIDFGETLEDFEDLVGTEDDENRDADDLADDLADDIEDAGGEGGENEDADADAGGGDADADGSDADGGETEEKERPKLKFDDYSVSGIARGLKEWVVENWRALTLKGKVAVVSSGIAFLAIILVIVIALNTRPFLRAYDMLDAIEAAQITNVLDANRIRHRSVREADGIAIYVREGEEGRATAALVESEHWFRGVVFPEDMGGGGGLFETQDDRRERIRRNLERGLMLTFNAMEGIVSSAVTLVLPDNSATIIRQDRQPPRATAVLFLEPDIELNASRIRGLENLLVHSVEGLEAENVVIIDAFGYRLNEFDDEETDDGGIFGHMSMIELRRRFERDYERHYAERIMNLFEGVFETVNVSVAVLTDFDRIITETMRYFGANIDEETGEMRGIPAAQAIDRILSGETPENVFGVIGGTDANVDPTGYFESGLAEDAQRFMDALHMTTEYLTSWTIEHWERTTPEITHMSISVIADGREHDEDELDELVWLVANSTAVGSIMRNNFMTYDDMFDAEFLRQFVSVMVMPFPPPRVFPPPPGPEFPPGFGGLTMFELWLAIGAFIILMIMFIVLLVALVRRSKRISEEEEDLEAFGELAPDGAGFEMTADDFAAAIGRPAVSDDADDMESSDEDDGKAPKAPIELREEHLKRQIKLFVGKNPEIAAQILKTLLRGDE